LIDLAADRLGRDDEVELLSLGPYLTAQWLLARKIKLAPKQRDRLRLLSGPTKSRTSTSADRSADAGAASAAKPGSHYLPSTAYPTA
jgi:hypothetical protein